MHFVVPDADAHLVVRALEMAAQAHGDLACRFIERGLPAVQEIKNAEAFRWLARSLREQLQRE